MPQPSAAQLHVDRWLTNMAIAWAQDEANFIAGRVFPTIPVTNESDLYLIYEKGSFYRTNQMRPRPLGGRPPSAGYEVTQGQYRCEEWSLEHKIDDRERSNADQPADPDVAGMTLLTSQALIQRDTLWTQQFFNTGIWGTDWTGVTSGPAAQQFLQWDQSGSDPIQFLRARRNDVGGKTGFMPNKAVFGTTAWEAFINHPDVVDRVKYTQAASDVARTEEQIAAALLKLDEVLIPTGVSNTAVEGQNDNIGFIVSPSSVLLCYAAPAPSIRQPSAGYGFAYTGLLPGIDNAFGGVIERGREELAHSDVLQVRASYDQRIVAPDLGEFFQTVVSGSYGTSTFKPQASGDPSTLKEDSPWATSPTSRSGSVTRRSSRARTCRSSRDATTRR